MDTGKTVVFPRLLLSISITVSIPTNVNPTTEWVEGWVRVVPSSFNPSRRQKQGHAVRPPPQKEEGKGGELR